MRTYISTRTKLVLWIDQFYNHEITQNNHSTWTYSPGIQYFLTGQISLIPLNHFAKLGLEIHIGRRPKPSKTECVLFPSPIFLRPSYHSSQTVDKDSSQITTPAKK